MAQTRILAVAAGRGGTGKSTLAFGLADVLRRMDSVSEVAILDLDPQAGITGYAKQKPSVDPLHDPPVEVHGMILYRGGRKLAYATDDEIAAHVERAVRDGTDRVVVADMAPALTDPAHRVVFDRSDVMMIGAIKTEPGSFQSLNELVADAKARGIPYLLVPTLHRKIILSETALLQMQAAFGEHLSEVVVPLDGRAAEAPLSGKPVTMAARGSRASQAIVQLVDEIFG